MKNLQIGRILVMVLLVSCFTLGISNLAFAVPQIFDYTGTGSLLEATLEIDGSLLISAHCRF